jgi:hypothetical protein
MRATLLKKLDHKKKLLVYQWVQKARWITMHTGRFSSGCEGEMAGIASIA